MQYIYSDNFKGHTSDYKNPETLKEHSDNILECSKSLCNKYDIDLVIDRLCSKLIIDGVDMLIFNRFIKDIFFNCIYLHDFGKINPFFQKYKMNSLVENIDIIKDKLKEITYDESIATHHSVLSVIYFLDFNYDLISKLNIDNKSKKYLRMIVNCFSYNILKHHSSILQKTEYDIFDENFIFYSNFIETEIVYKKLYKDNDNIVFCKDNEYLWYLLRLNFSVLTKSDYLSTINYLYGFKHEENVLTDNLKNKLNNNFWNSENLKDGSVNFNKNLTYDNSINSLRIEMLNQAVDTYSKSKSNIFFLECPTGGGKTNVALALTTKMLESSTKKIFYIFPFTKIGEQTEKTMVNVFHLNDDEYSFLTYDSFKENADLNDNQNNINNTFTNYPVLLMSHVRFFNMLTSNKKSDIYNMIQITNSIVIIDEIQSYPPSLWSRLVYLIDKYSEIFNIKFIIMSATLPKIDKLIGSNKFIDLIPDRDKYFKNKIFMERVKIDDRYLNEDISLINIKDYILSHSEEYYNKNNKIHVIVEFIYKKDASSFSKKHRNEFTSLGYEVLLLSSTTLNNKGLHIINTIKNGNLKKILLICTQTIEAGVDIDMDMGFKDVSIIDSEEQFAGRINRNSKKENSTLFLFNLANKYIYKTDERYKFNKVYDEKYLDILRNKNFSIFYDKILTHINKLSESNKENKLVDFKKFIKENNHEDICNSFKIIEDNSSNKKIFITLNIPLAELYMFNISIFEKYGLVVDNELNYSKVLERQKELLLKKDFISVKKFSKIFNLFVVSLFLSDKKFISMLNYMIYDIDLNIHVLTDNNIYDYNDGFNLDRLSDDIKYEFI